MGEREGGRLEGIGGGEGAKQGIRERDTKEGDRNEERKRKRRQGGRKRVRKGT